MNNFSFTITFFDETGIWLGVWNTLKEQLAIHFATIKYKDNLNSMKTLLSLNIKMIDESNNNNNINKSEKSENSNLHIYVTKINTTTDLKNGVKERIINNFLKFKNSVHLIVMDIENSDSSVKTAMKNFEKIKSELKNPELKLLPITSNYGKVSDIISEFFLFLKNKISNEINDNITSHIKHIESFKQSKIDSKDVNAIYNYFGAKEKLLNYLQLAELWEAIIKLCDEDLFIIYPQIQSNSNNPDETNNFVFTEPFSFLDFNENLIRQKINERSLANLEYQQYLFYQVIKCCKFLRDYRKLNLYITRFLIDLIQFKIYFRSKYHFQFWCYQFTLRLIPYIKSLKSNTYSSSDEEINIRTQITIYNNSKKFLKNLASFIKFEIPNIKIFSLLINKKITNEKDLNREINTLVTCQTEVEKKYLENDQTFSVFIKDIKENIDDKLRLLFTDKYKLLEEYLNILSNLEKFHLSLNQYKVTMKIQIEKLPLFLVLNRYTLIPDLLLSLIKILKKEKWDFLYEFLHYIYIIMINCMGKNEVNLKIIIEFLNLKFKCIKELNKIFNKEDENENIITNILSSYIQKCKVDLNTNIIMNFDDIISVSTNYDKKYVLSVNLNLEKTGNLNLNITNKSKLTFQISNIILNFNEEVTNKEITQEYYYQDLVILKPELNLDQKVLLNYEDILNKIKNTETRNSLKSENFLCSLTSIRFILSSKVLGIYKIQPLNTGIKLNLRQNNFEVKSCIKSYSLDELFYYNTLYSLVIELKNFNEYKFKGKRLKILTDSPIESSIFKVVNRFEIRNANGVSLKQRESNRDKIIIDKSEVIFSEGISIEEDLIILELFFFIEDTDFYKASIKKIDVITRITDSESEIEFCSKESHILNMQHIFTLTHKTRLEKENNILIQTSINLNLDMNDVKVYSAKDKLIELDILQTLNLIKIINKNYLENLSDLNFNFIIDKTNFKFIYPYETINEKIIEMLKLPYFIKISVETNKEIKDLYQDGVQLFTEFSLVIGIRKYIKDDILIMLRIKENDNWSIIGKSRIIETIANSNEQDSQEFTKSFKLIPMQDGYVKLPEIEFMEYKINSNNTNDLKNINSLEFLPFPEGCIIEGNTKIVKVYSINSCALRLNYI